MKLLILLLAVAVSDPTETLAQGQVKALSKKETRQEKRRLKNLKKQEMGWSILYPLVADSIHYGKSNLRASDPAKKAFSVAQAAAIMTAIANKDKIAQTIPCKRNLEDLALKSINYGISKNVLFTMAKKEGHSFLEKPVQAGEPGYLEGKTNLTRSVLDTLERSFESKIPSENLERQLNAVMTQEELIGLGMDTVEKICRVK